MKHYKTPVTLKDVNEYFGLNLGEMEVFVDDDGNVLFSDSVMQELLVDRAKQQNLHINHCGHPTMPIWSEKDYGQAFGYEGLTHREDGPALTVYGTEDYYWRGQCTNRLIVLVLAWVCTCYGVEVQWPSRSVLSF